MVCCRGLDNNPVVTTSINCCFFKNCYMCYGSINSAPTLVLKLSNFDRLKAGKFSLSLFLLSLFSFFLPTNSFPFSLFSFFFSPFLFFFPFYFSILFLFSHLISLSFSPYFLLSLCISLPMGWALTVLVKRRKFPSPFLNPNLWPSIFHPYSLFHISSL